MKIESPYKIESPFKLENVPSVDLASSLLAKWLLYGDKAALVSIMCCMWHVYCPISSTCSVRS